MRGIFLSSRRSPGPTLRHCNVIWRSASTGSSVMQLVGQGFGLKALLRETNLLTKCLEKGGGGVGVEKRK